MPVTRCFNVLSERHSGQEIKEIIWNPKIDVLALLTSKGDVILQRLFWKRAWRSSTKTPATAAAWSPSGKLLAVGDEDSNIRLLNAENGRLLYSVPPASPVSAAPIVHLSWFRCEMGMVPKDVQDDMIPKAPAVKDEPGYASSKGGSIPPMEKWCLQLEDSKNGALQSVLAAIDEYGSITILLAGFYPFIRFNAGLSGPVQFQASSLAKSMSNFLITYWPGGSISSPAMQGYDTSKCLSINRNRLCGLSLKIARLQKSVENIDNTLQRIKDGWEDVAQELDIKLSEFAKDKFLTDGGCVGDDLISLLMFGKASANLEAFLLHTLTSKELKQVTSFVEKSYQKTLELISQDLRRDIATVSFHLADLKHASLDGVEMESIFSTPLYTAGVVVLKISEVKSVIIRSRVKLHTFLRWLQRSVFQMSENSIPPEFLRMTQDDYDMIVEIIEETFMNVWSEDAPTPFFRLETVGQYFKDEPLSSQYDDSDNPWEQLAKSLTKDPASKVSNFIHRPDKESSLSMLISKLKTELDIANQEIVKQASNQVAPSPQVKLEAATVFAKPKTCESNEAATQRRIFINREEEDENSIRFYNFSFDSVSLGAFEMDAIGIPTVSWARTINWNETRLTPIDFGILNPNTMMVLVRKRSSMDNDNLDSFYILKQGNLAVLQNDDAPEVDLSDSAHWENLTPLEGPDHHRITVNGGRSTGSVLRKCGTWLKLLDFNVTEDTTMMKTPNASSSFMERSF